jgi:DNA processing protein
VIVEAAKRSGAANTASHCFTIGRPVMAVPGPVTSPMSAGCHELLRRPELPALLVTCVDDVLQIVGGIGEIASDPSAPSHPLDRQSRIDALDPIARRVLDGLPARRRARPEQIAVRCGVSTLEVIRALPALDLAGLLDTADDGYRIAAVPARSH